MKAPELYAHLRLFGQLLNKNAIAADYRALAIAPDHIRAAGLFGRMEREVALGLDREIKVEADAFLQTVRSLPDAEFNVRLADGALRWSCGQAKGHLALLSGVNVPDVEIAGDTPEMLVGSKFADGLELAALARGTDTLRTLNLLGVQIVGGGRSTFAYSTDNYSLSCCRLDVPFEPGTVTLLPDAIDLLAQVVRRDGKALLTRDTSSLFCVTLYTQLLLYQVPALRKELSEIIAPYLPAEIAVPLIRNSVDAFLRRAGALSEEKAKATIEVAVENGRLCLAFQTTGSSSEEFILTNGPPVTVPPIAIEVRRLAKALAHADRLVFDHAARGYLVLRGAADFIFVISGRSARARGEEEHAPRAE